MGCSYLVCIFSLLGLVFWSMGAKLVIEPERIRTLNRTATVTVKCKTAAPLTACQWSMFLGGGNASGPIIDLAGEAKSRMDLAHWDSDTAPFTNYTYVGLGLRQGECGIKLELRREKTLLVSCRVRTDHAWIYQWMEVDGTYADAQLNHEVDPIREVHAVPGGISVVQMMANRALKRCVFHLGGQRPLVFSKGANSSRSQGRHLYHGPGLSDGKCGLEVRNVSEEDNGLLMGLITRNKQAEYRLKPFIVARPPSPPRLMINYTDDKVVATCLVEDSRPPPTFFWKLGSEELDGDLEDVSPGESDAPWRWPWSSGPSAQRITFTARQEYEGKMLKCVVSNEAPAVPREAFDLVSALGACGVRRSNNGVGLIANGERASVGEFPWHVGIYRLTGGTYEQQCGGTLVTPNTVISAAHCFWDKNQKAQKDRYRVVGGVLGRRWNESSPGLQMRKVQKVDTGQYAGRKRNYDFDLSIVYLQEPMLLSDSVGLACIDWSSRMTLRQGDVGVVAGWGFTETNEQSDALNYIDLPYLPRDDCLKAIEPSLQRALPQSKFCAGYRHLGKSVCSGDSGGGLVFRDNVTDRYFLKGVVSTDFRPQGHGEGCYSELYTTFTDVAGFVQWIRHELVVSN